MPFTRGINYDNAGNFIFDPSKIEIDSARAKLKLIPNPGQIFSQDFASDSGFTYNNALAEFTGGLVRQKHQMSGGLIAAQFSASKNANWTENNLSTSATDIGTPVISGGKLDVAGGNNGVYFENNDIGLASSVGAIRFKFTPSYSGTPDVNHGVVSLSNPSAPIGANNLLLLHSLSGGTWRITARDNSNTSIHSAVTIGAAWSPTAGTEYEIELNWNLSTYGIRLFINGVVHGTLATLFTRGSGATRIYVGSNASYSPGRGAYRDVVLFSVDQHTSGYTPGYTVPSTKYLGSKIDLPVWPYTGVGTILSVTNAVVIESGAPRFIVGGRYFNLMSSAWEVSNGSYAQASTSAVVIANLGSFNAVGAPAITASIVFDDSNTLSSVDDVDVEVTGQIYPTDNPTIIDGSGVSADELFSFLASIVASGSDAVQFVINVSGVDKYWNGSAWANSNGTYAQSNDASTILTNIAALDLSAGYTIKIKAFLHSDTGQTTPELESVSFSYDFFAPTPADPNRCVLYGFLNDMIGLIKDTPQQAKLICETFSVFNYGERMVGPYRRVFRFNSNGYVETTPSYLETADPTAEDGLIETETLSLAPYKLTVQYRNSDGKLVTFGVDGIEVPNQVSKNLKEYDFA